MPPTPRTRGVRVLLGLSFVLFVIGVVAPVMTLKKFVFFEDRLSIVSGLLRLIQEGQYLLFGIVFTFSIAFPFLKMVLLYRACQRQAWSKPGLRKTLHWLSVFGKWSMLDVFIVALFVVMGRFRGIAEVEVHYGLYVFATAVIVLHITAFWLDRRVQRLTTPWDAP